MSPSPRHRLWQHLARTTWLFFPFTSASSSPRDNKVQVLKDKDAPAQQQQQQQKPSAPNPRAASSGTGTGRTTHSSSAPLPVVAGLAGLGLESLDTNDAAIALATAAFLLGSASSLGASAVYRRYFKRIRSAEWITPDMLKRRRWITGIVTSVGDADNFRLYHTPGFGWRGLVKFRDVPLDRRGLKGQTIHIRLAAMDAPEGAYFGRPSQPYYPEAIAWLKANIEGRRVKCELLRRDQYGRVVALPLLPRTFRPWHHCHRWWTPQGSRGGSSTTSATTRNLPLEMVRAGWGVVYTQKGAEYGSGMEKETYLAAEAEAQAARRGMWQHGTNIESPADYKKRYRAPEVEADDGEGELPPPAPSEGRVGFWSWIFGRRKRGGDGPS